MRLETITVLPLGGIEQDVLAGITNGLEKVYGSFNFSILPAKQTPLFSLDRWRNQYRSDMILEFLEWQMEGRVLAVTDSDLYAPRLNFVFGQAELGGKVALVSIKRLDPIFYGEPSNPQLLLERAVKECVHELGHTFGLDHCTNTNCVMSFSNSIADVDKKSGNLCESCRAKFKASFNSSTEVVR